MIEAAQAHGASFDVLLVCPELLNGVRSWTTVARFQAEHVRTLVVSEKTFTRLSNRDRPDGLASVARLTASTWDDLSIGHQARVLVLDNLAVPGNVGSLLRSASATGIAVVVVVGRMRLNHPLIAKSSVGAVFSVPIVSASGADAVAWLRAERFQIVAAHPAATVSFRDVPYRPRVAIVLGSERFGLDAMWTGEADRLASIPMQGHVDSLNAGHAGAIFMFEVAHQHSRHSGGA